MPIYAFEGKHPSIAASAYISPTATVIGNVTIGEGCYIGHGAILRGDYGNIEIGDETAVEEGVIIHARPEDWTRIGRRVTLGHGAMVHNATILDEAVIGMRAVISDFSEVGAGAIVGEMGLVKNSQKVPAGKVAVGAPVKVVGEVGERHRPMAKWAKDLYVGLARRYSEGAMVELADHPGDEALPPLKPIGSISTPYSSRSEAPRQGSHAPDTEGEIHLDPAYAEGLSDLDGFSHLVVLFHFHRADRARMKVTPPSSGVERGLFATRAPCRPNPIGMTVVRLLAVEGTTLRVAGVDMLDGTPLLDLKPYVPALVPDGPVEAGWIKPGMLCPRADDSSQE